ncbi:putative amidohydrolase [Schinkia azotoformans MEV2011]|uniref:Putative amidohydrolase n=1 Tax=Schinkia azotoformans MEV2011 TaxID=1348973 RepID=A0A072NJ22_SCHAZ|nr:carbon-nitrogen hydrolase family protein [Schinkia azotoformans]KEF37267.1 putative amidohydrolase [Schinkia azotoformans MEV2011]MEC1695498.1 carbon-nitrogen hydrolase family protein [Schinkia azotoformans]MEC1718707.1 carbon-nitrogen hydrolase family protein [Schinkia azotoformans]MEC1727147.1 carbon-nitrogen hydrolase family protein [Schinkia azotoformans]MEC1743758.1 carbon-nitrogen hydrolase family protein [Schinkia azotoformans]
MDKLKVSMVQMQVTDDVDKNVQTAIALIRDAAQSNPDVIVLPENFHLMGTKEDLFKKAETIDGPTITKLREVAKELGTYIVAGTMKLRIQGEEKLRNSCCVINPDGDIQDVYDKIHTFNARVGGRTYAGNQVEQSGDQIIVTNIKGVPVGLSVCFDLRFPEMFRILALKGSKVILVPALFMLHTGKDHWEVLLRARAIENQVYMVAPATHGTFPPNGDWTYGRSLVVDPWGLVIAQASDGDGVVTVDLDLNLVEDVRKRVPTLSQRRPNVYNWNEFDN